MAEILSPNLLGQEELALNVGVDEEQLPFEGQSTDVVEPPEPVQEESEPFDPVASFMGMDIEEQRKVLMGEEFGSSGFRQLRDVTEQTKFLNDLKEDSILVASLFDQGQIPEGTPEHTTAQQVYLKVKPFVKMPAEIAALTAGAIVGAPVAPPFGSVAGAGLSFGMVRNLFKMTESLLGLREPRGFVQEAQETVADIEEGAVAETGGQLAAPLLRGGTQFVKRQIGKLGEKTTLTQAGAKKRASEIVTEELKGTELTQRQIDENVKIAKGIEAEVRRVDPDFQFTQGQLTNDASAIALERTLGRRDGQDLTQSQRQHAVEVLRQYYNKKVLSTGTTEDFSQLVARMGKELELSTKEGVNAVEAEVARLNRHLEPQVFGTKIHENLSKGKAILRKKADVLYNKIPNLNLETKTLSEKMNVLIKAEDGLIEPRTQKMISLLNKEILRKAPSAGITTINPATGQKTIQRAEAVTKPVKYQVLRKLRSKIGRNYSDASAGVQPAIEDARQLFQLRRIVDEAMAQVAKKSPEAKAAFDKATKFYSEEFIPTFRQGSVANVLQRGGRGEETKIAKANIAQAFNSLGGIDDLVRAAGRPQSASMMKDFYSFDFINKALDTEGKVVTTKASRWLSQNMGKLRKLGLVDEFRGVANQQAKVDNFIKNQNVFNKSIAGRILEADVDNMVANAYRGSKDVAQTTQKLLDLTEGNLAAKQGLKKAFAEFLTKESETNVPGFFQSAGGTTEADIEFLKSSTKMNALFKKFKPAINKMFADEPKKLKAINDVWDGLRILERTVKSPIGGGSDTAELIFKTNPLGRSTSLVVGGVAPRAFYPWKVVRDWVQRFGQANVEQYMTKAMFDPEYAAIMTEAARLQGREGSLVQQRILQNTKSFERLMSAVSVAGDIPETASTALNEELE